MSQMTERFPRETLHDPVDQHMRTDFVQLHPDQTVGEALESILQKQPAGRIIYFYVADSEGRLLGVVPTRRLLLSARDNLVSQIMIRPVISIPRTATVLDACEFFILHKLLAFPIVDDERRIIGLVDVELYTRELQDLDRRESYDDLFQLIGVHASEAQQESIGAGFRRRFPWLLAALAGGVLAAVISDVYYEVASLALVLPFIPLVLGLASSVTAQSVSLVLQSMHSQRAAWGALFAAILREFSTAAMLGAACGSIAAAIVFVWKGDLTAALSLLGAIMGSAACAGSLGVALPYLFRMLKFNPLVAAGPIALASADAVTLLVYFNLARWWLA